jgi:hypothetical protein
MSSLSVVINPSVRRWVEAAPLFVVMVLWGLHLGYPLHLLQHVRGNIFGHVIPIYYFFIVLPMVGAAALMLALKRQWTRWEVFWWMLPLICLPGILLSADRLWSLRQWSSWVIRGVVPGGILFSAARSKSSAMLTCWIYPVIIAASLVGLWEVYDDGRINLWDNSLQNVRLDASQSGDSLFYRPQDSNYQLPLSNRPGGTQGNRLAYASTLVGFLPLGMWLLKYKKGLYPLRLAALAILSSILLLSQVRAVWLAVLVSLVSMQIAGLLRTRKESAKMVVGAAVCLAIFLAWPRTHKMLWSRLNSLHLADASISARLQFLQTAGVLKEHWLSGVGFGQFPVACRSFVSQDLWAATAENQILRWAIENGIGSLSLLLAFFLGLVRASWMKIQSMEDVMQADFAKSLFIGWLGVAVTFVFFDGFYWGACNMTFWCLLGMLAASLTTGNSRKAEGIS